jgi:hypothetical protein
VQDRVIPLREDGDPSSITFLLVRVRNAARQIRQGPWH